ncbi:hypothetical protein [Cellulomonas denverensis]|uniref:Uncharacterized protein n=1 Tax=Cellulomonas denverensis TaxID=264297 RepID=A0A7X6KW53_9CELL|nr:hypothetical protein [Cellulomonas denverensis]NKY23220.1 hypothetical protein [Cellulomonas denverensis]GIG26338.1 hypothetical protein Cde04nite_25820 [Cellulomonas denverensis]
MNWSDWEVPDGHIALSGLTCSGVFRGLLDVVSFRAVAIMTSGRGPVQLAVQVLDEPPASVPQDWEDVVDTSITPAGPDDVILESFDRSRPRVRLLPTGSGSQRLRLHARGRSSTSQIAEAYLLTVWPSALDQPRVLRGGWTAATQPPWTTAPYLSERDQRLVDDMHRKLLEQGRRRQR